MPDDASFVGSRPVESSDNCQDVALSSSFSELLQDAFNQNAILIRARADHFVENFPSGAVLTIVPLIMFPQYLAISFAPFLKISAVFVIPCSATLILPFAIKLKITASALQTFFMT